MARARLKERQIKRDREDYHSIACVTLNPDKQVKQLAGLTYIQHPSHTTRDDLSVLNSVFSVQVLVNLTLTYDRRENNIYEDCKDLIRYNFEQNNFQVTAPFRKTFSPLGCPGISTSQGGQLVDTEYFCLSGKMIKFTADGFTSPIDVCG